MSLSIIPRFGSRENNPEPPTYLGENSGRFPADFPSIPFIYIMISPIQDVFFVMV
jgi:hypothetical protein